MATITAFLSGGTTGHPANKRTPYLVEGVVDFSLSTIADGDVIQVINVPAETLILAAGMEVLTAVAGMTTPSFDLGYGTDQDEWASNVDVTATGYATPVGNGTAAHVAVLITTADTIDIDTTDTSSGTATSGKIRVWAVLQDVSGIRESATGDQG